MARSEARIFTSIWSDPAFLALPPSAQRMYLFLLSQDDLEYSGLVPLRPNRWAQSAQGLTSQKVHADLAVLESAGMVIVDRSTEELWVRALMRRDEVWKQWTLLTAAYRSARKARSPYICEGISEELGRIWCECQVTGKAERVLKQFSEEFPLVGGHKNSLPEKGVFQGVSGAIAERLPSAGEGGRVVTTGTTRSNHSFTENEYSLRSYSSSDPAESDASKPDQPGQRGDVDRLCAHLADRVEQQTGRRPTVGVHWRRAARLLLDLDHRTEDQVHAAIDWCQNDEFWRANVLSMSKLREKYITLRAQAQRQANGKSSTTNVRVGDALELAAEYRRQETKAIE